MKRRIKFDSVSVNGFNEFRNKSIVASTPINKCKKLEQYFKLTQLSNKASSFDLFKVKFNSTIFKNLSSKQVTVSNDKMLPSMPSLSTPCKKSPEKPVSPQNEEPLPSLSNTDECEFECEQNKLEVAFEETTEKVRLCLYPKYVLCMQLVPL